MNLKQLKVSTLWYLVNKQVAGACGNGHVIFAHVIEKRLEWRDYEASVTGNVLAVANKRILMQAFF